MLLNVNNLSVKYKKENEATIKDVTFGVESGKVTVLLGRSGTGKSTILNSISDLLSDAEINGKIEINSKKIGRWMYYSTVSLLFQGYPLYETLSVRSNILNAYESSQQYLIDKKLPGYKFTKEQSDKLRLMDEKSTKEWVKNIVKQEGIISAPIDFVDRNIEKAASELQIELLIDKKPKDISGGQRQRVAIAKALIKQPQLMILDEPFSALDKKTSFKLINIINDLKREKNIGFLISTHDIGFLETYADEVLLIDDGIIIQRGLIDEIYSNPKSLTVMKYFDPYISKMAKDTFVYSKSISLDTKTSKPNYTILSAVKTIDNDYRYELVKDKTKDKVWVIDTRKVSTDRKVGVKILNNYVFKK